MVEIRACVRINRICKGIYRRQKADVSADIIIYGLVAAGLVLWLRSILGTKHGEERERPNPFTSAPPSSQDVKNRAEQPPAAQKIPEEENPEDETVSPVTSLNRNDGIAVPEAEIGLSEIARADRRFELPAFLQGAKDAFAMIVEAYARGDRETLSSFLAPDVFSSFDSAIAERDSRGETMTADIHAVRRAEIIRASLSGRHAYITVRFTADETTIVQDRDGNILQGNPDKITEMVDVWTFGRDTRSQNPTWLVCETRDDLAEDSREALPEAGSIEKS